MAEMPPALARESVEKRQVSRKVRSEERREQVLGRMTDVFAKRGYQAATVDHLIAGGKISMGGFYKEFNGKEDAFVAVYDRVMAELGRRLEEALPAGAEWAVQAAVGLRTVVEFASEKPLAARVVLLEAQSGGALALGRYTATLQGVAEFLRAGRTNGGASALPESFEEATASGLAWLLQSRLAKERIEDPAELWPRMAKMALEPYIGAARAAQTVRSVS
jgi:AcrR family transcriptional regulator